MDFEHLTEKERREAAVCLLAAENAMCDDMTAEEAIAHARRGVIYMDSEDSIWKDGQHSGDCTKTAHTCLRCMVEEAEALADWLYEDGDWRRK